MGASKKGPEVKDVTLDDLNGTKRIGLNVCLQKTNEETMNNKTKMNTDSNLSKFCWI